LSCIAGAKNNEKDRESADFDLLVKSLINFFSSPVMSVFNYASK
jgi:hypothetical protein